MSARLREMLIRHEGLRNKAYVDSVGKITVGVGRCIDSLGISNDEAMLLLSNDIARITLEAGTLNFFNSLDVIRQDAIMDMLFNLGLTHFLEFKKMISALCAGNYSEAASEMLSSSWASQVGPRAIELAQMIRTGLYR